MTNRVLRLLAFAIVLPGMISTPALADDLAAAQAFIGKQTELIKQGDVAGLKAGLTPRHHDKVTDAVVKSAQEEVSKLTVEELVAAVEPGKDSLKIKMKNGRALTTLVKVDGSWLADTVWFK